MADLRIADAPELDESEVQGGLKIPTGGFGNKAINMNTVASWVVKDKDLPSKDYVDTAVEQSNQGLSGHVTDKNNPHGVTKSQVGLGNVNNTADADKPISNATSAALNLKADKTQLDAKADKTQLQGLATTTQLDLKADKTQLDTKADKSTTYTKTEVYSKDEVDSEILENGAALPYDVNRIYTDGAIVVDNGALKKVEGGALVNAVTAESVSIGDSTLDVFAQNSESFKNNQTQINSRTVTPYDFGAIGDGRSHPLSERFSTLAEAQEVYPSATALTELIDGHALNAWWRDICANDRKYATCHGYFISNTKISNLGLNTYSNPIKTKHINFSAKVRFDGVTSIGWQMISLRQTELSGYLEMWDVGGVNFANRTIDYLLYLEDFIHSDFTWQVNLKYARIRGMLVVSGPAGTTASGLVANNNTSNLGKFQFGSCGHRFKHGTFNFTERVDNGGSRAVDQRTKLTVAESLPFSDLSGGLIRYKGLPYLITANTDNTLTVYPWIKELDTTGSFEISYGGDFALTGPDSNNIKMSSGSSDCALCAAAEGFYVGTKLQRTNEGNDVGLMLGNGVNNVQVGGTYLGTYFEINEFDIVKTSVTKDNALIIRPIALNKSKCFSLAPIAVTERTPAPTLTNSWIVDDGLVQHKQKYLQYSDGSSYTTSIAASFENPNFKLRANAAVITLTDDVKHRELFGNVDIEFEVFGFGAGNIITDVTTIKCQDGYKINGLAQDFTIAAGATPFKVSARLVGGNDWRVYVFSSGARTLTVSKTYDPPSIEAGKMVQTTIAGAAFPMGTPVIAAFSQYATGLVISAAVSSANIITVTFQNTSASAIDLASGTLTVKSV